MFISKTKDNILIVFSAIIIFFFISNFFVNKIYFLGEAERIYFECQKENREECLEAEILKYAKENPKNMGKLLQAFEDLHNNRKTLEKPEFFLYLVHDVGMLFVSEGIPVKDAFLYCGTSFMKGCIHGVVMEYADINDKSKSNIKSLLSFCEDSSTNSVIYLNCLHGIGHVLASKEYPVLQNVVNLCDIFTDPQEKVACSSGVFMEYSKGQAGQGVHSEMPTGQVHLNCYEFVDLYYKVCNVYNKYYEEKKNMLE